MNTDQPNRRPGPHAPLPSVSAAVNAAIPELPQEAPQKAAIEEDPRIRAARRAEQLREHRGSSGDDGVDKFYIDPRIVPDGWSYEYRMFTVLGKEDPSYQVGLAQKGWEPVPAHRHPELMPVGYKGSTILRDGLMLMERPKEITDEAKAADYRRARDQVRAKEEQIGGAPPGTFERNNKGIPLASVKKSYESIPIPEK